MHPSSIIHLSIHHPSFTHPLLTIHHPLSSVISVPIPTLYPSIGPSAIPPSSPLCTSFHLLPLLTLCITLSFIPVSAPILGPSVLLRTVACAVLSPDSPVTFTCHFCSLQFLQAGLFWAFLASTRYGNRSMLVPPQSLSVANGWSLTVSDCPSLFLVVSNPCISSIG